MAESLKTLSKYHWTTIKMKDMKKMKLQIVVCLLGLLSQSFITTDGHTPNEILGYYWSPEKDAKIQIYLKGQEYFGKFVWLAKPRKDIKNPDKALRNRDILGMELLKGLTYDDGSYSGGDIYDPESGKTYSCKMSFDGSRLKVRGYIGFSLFGRTEYFERIK